METVGRRPCHERAFGGGRNAHQPVHSPSRPMSSQTSQNNNASGIIDKEDREIILSLYASTLRKTVSMVAKGFSTVWDVSGPTIHSLHCCEAGASLLPYDISFEGLRGIR